MNLINFSYIKKNIISLIQDMFITKNKKNKYKIQNISVDWFLDILNYNSLVNNYYKQITFKLYFAEQDEIELFTYLYVLAYISNENTSFKEENKNILTLFIFIVKFQKNINIYSALTQKIFLKIKNTISILIFNLK